MLEVAMPADIASPQTGRDLDRRAFLVGGWLKGRGAGVGADGAVAATIRVQVVPVREGDVEREIQALDAALGGISITSRPGVGRLTVAVRDGAAVGPVLGRLASLPGVLTAAIDSGKAIAGARP